jgi:putative ABC transport system permease protein
MLSVLLDTLVTGLPLVAAYAGVHVLFRVLGDFDLSVDGTFVTGGAVGAVLLMHGVPAALCVVAAALAGAVMGLGTAFVHIALRIPILLAGLVMSLALFSVNLRIMGQPNLSLLTTSGIFDPFAGLPATQRDLADAGLLLAIDVVVLSLLVLFLRTEIGLAMRATGVNPTMARAQGVSRDFVVGLGLMLANGLTAFAGAVTVQLQGFADVNGGTGTLIAGVGALLLGELLLRPSTARLGRVAAGILAGALLYQLVQVVALRLGLAATDLKLVTAATLVAAVGTRIGAGRLSAWAPRLRAVDREPVT